MQSCHMTPKIFQMLSVLAQILSITRREDEKEGETGERKREKGIYFYMRISILTQKLICYYVFG